MVRKRKNSEEDTVSPRQTRRGRVKSDDSGKTLDASKSRKSPKTPTTERRTTRTQVKSAQRQATATKRGRKATNSKSSSDSGNENAPETSGRSKRKNVKDDSQIVIGNTRSRKRRDANVSQDLLNSTKDTVVDVPVMETKKRGKKNKESSLISEDESPPAKKRTPAKKKSPAKKSPGKSSGRTTRAKGFAHSDSLISDDEYSDKKNNRIIFSQSNLSKNSLISEDESTLVDQSQMDSNFVIKKSLTPKKIVDTPRKPSPRKSVKTETNSPINTVTPESSPMVVSLTPHRTTKTPRKSPMNLSSPKTHSHTPLRLSKTPRKLPVTISSPATSDKSGVSSNRSTPRKCAPAGDSAGSTPIVNLVYMNELAEKLSPTPGRSGSTSRTPVSATKLNSSRFSKSPKIVLKSPKSKSPTSRKKVAVLTSKARKSPTKAAKSPKKSLTYPVKKSPLKSPGSLKSAKSPNSAKKVTKTPSPRKASKSPAAGPSKTPLRNPRIILSAVRSPTGTPVKKVRTPASKIRKSPVKTPPSRSPTKTPKSKSPKATFKKTPSSKTGTPLTKMKKTPLKTSSVRTSASVGTPRKTPAKTPSFRTNASVKTPRKSPEKKTPINLKKSPIAVDSLRKPRSTNKKRSPRTTSGTPLRPIPIPRNSALKKSTSKLLLDSPSGTPTKITNKNLDIPRSLITSSPRGRIRRSLNMSPDFKTISPVSTSSPIHTPKGGAKKSPQASKLTIDKFAMLNHVAIENESNPLQNDTDLLVMSDVFDDSTPKKDGTYEVTKQTSFVVEEEDIVPENATYELDEPKTPNLRRKSRKRSLSVTDLDNSNPVTKRTCRVRFASPVQENKIQKTVHGHGSATSNISAPRAGVKRTSAGVALRSTLLKEKTPENNRLSVAQSRSSARSKISERIRRRSNSMSNATLVVKSGINRRSNSVSGINEKTPKLSQRTQDSVNRLSRPRNSVHSEKKPEVKTPVARKAPNFAQIHQRKFAKMESLVDAKKRVADRHVVLSSAATANTSKLAVKIPTFTGVSGSTKVAPADATNGAFNRFGFKLRKNEAVDVISKKQQPVKSRAQKQQESRTVLKGVRMNRRFELHMKARNIKP